MRQGKLFPNTCPATDDNGVRCQNDMTDVEVKRDGMCERCAEGIWASMQEFNGEPKFVIKNPHTREF